MGGGGEVALAKWIHWYFLYSFLKVFAEKEISFILTFLHMMKFVKHKVWLDWKKLHFKILKEQKLWLKGKMSKFL